MLFRSDVNGKYADYSQGAIFYSSAVNPATRFVNSLIYALIAGVGAYRIMSGGAFTVGQLTTFLNYVTSIPNLLMISHLFYLNFKVLWPVLIAFI